MSAIIHSINGVSVPQPIRGGFSFQPETVWSSNTGRTASGLMVGDIVAIKYTFNIEWARLTEAEALAILNAVSNVNKPFFTIVYTPLGGTTTTKTVYTGSGSPKIVRFDDAQSTSRPIQQMTLQLIEQ